MDRRPLAQNLPSDLLPQAQTQGLTWISPPHGEHRPYSHRSLGALAGIAPWAGRTFFFLELKVFSRVAMCLSHQDRVGEDQHPQFSTKSRPRETAHWSKVNSRTNAT